MRATTNIFKIIIAIICCNLTFSQNSNTTATAEPLKRNEGTISDQFEYVIRKSYTYKNAGKSYKSVQYHWLTELKASVSDSLEAINANLNATKTLVSTHEKEITSLKDKLSATEKTLETTKSEKNSMSLFGMQLSKTSYNVLLWSIIVALLALLTYIAYRFSANNTATKTAKLKLEELEDEYENHRRIALEREQKVRRQLQDEINKKKGK